MFSAFVHRRRWATVLICLVPGPVVGMLYLGKGRNAAAYFLASIAAALLPFIAAHLDVIGNPKLFVIWPLNLIGAVHGWAIAKKMAGNVPKVWFARWNGIVALGFVLPVVAAQAIRSLLWEPFFIPANSMLPTLVVGDHLWVSKFAYGYSRFSLPFAPDLFSGRIFGHEPERGDIIVFKLPTDERIDYIKRVIGLPGDQIQIRQGRLFINGTQVARQPFGFESEAGKGGATHQIPRFVETLPNGRRYFILEETDSGPGDNTRVYVIPQGRYFVLGDNRDSSFDSRLDHVGFVPYENIVGRFVIVFWNEKTRKIMFDRRP